MREREMPLLATLCWFVLTFEATLGQSLTGTAGEAVSLSCGSNSGCTWSKDEVELVLEDRSDQARYSFGSSCSLTIEPLLPGDEGEYECNNEKSRHRLTVLVEVGVPYIEEGRHGTLEVEDGHQVELRCTSQGGKPAAEIEWKRDGQSVIELEAEAEVEAEVTKMGDGWKTQSTFTFRPQESTNVTCSASNEVMREPRVSSALEVRVRGRPRVEVRVDQEVIREGDSFEVLCKSSAYPEDVGYRWFFSGSELEGMTDNALLIEEISRMYDQADITCLVENEEGQGQGSTQLNVQFPPTIVLHPRSQVAKKEGKCYFPLCGRRKSSSLLCLDSRTGGFSAEGWYAEPQPGGKREDGGSLSLPCVLRRQRDRLIPSCQSHTDQEASGEDGIRKVGQPWTGCHPQLQDEGRFQQDQVGLAEVQWKGR